MLAGMKNGVNASWGAIRIGIYHRHIRRWLEHFPLHQIHFVDGERLITNPALEIRAVERFLTLKPGEKSEYCNICIHINIDEKLPDKNMKKTLF